METLAIILAAVGSVLAFLGMIRLLVAAYRDGAAWLLVSLLIPFGVFVFALLHWSEARRPFLLWLSGFALWCVAYTLAPNGDWMNPMY